MRILRGLYLTILLTILTVSLPVYSRQALEREDVQKTMKRLLEYHVDEHDVTPLIMQRSLKVYLDSFDSQKIYLHAAEIEPILNPSAEKLQAILEQYNRGDYSEYERINALIRESISRARLERQSLYALYDELLSSLSDSSENTPLSKEKETYAEDANTLAQRQKEHFVEFLQVQAQLAKTSLDDKKDKVISLYERRLLSKEDDFILDALPEGFASKEAYFEHQTVLALLKSLAKSLDAHTTYFSPQEAYNMRMQLEKGFQGIGVVLQESLEGILIQRLIEGGPAEESGQVLKGDTIISVGGETVEDKPFDRVLEMIRGENDSEIRLGLRRPSSDSSGVQELTVALKRRMIVIDDKRVDVSYENFGDGIVGTLTLHSFYEGGNGISSEQDLQKAIKDLSVKGKLKGLVLDLRENSGGFLSQAVKVAGLFISNGVVAVSRYSNGATKYFRDLDGQAFYQGPLVVLTSKASASAAEIVAQTLQDYGAALVVGDNRTYGKGSIQHQTVTKENAESFFKVTVGRYYTVSGKSTQIDGVRADIVVPSDYYNVEIGEEFLQYPLKSDAIAPAFEDSLADIDRDFREWFDAYYFPSLQKKNDMWRRMLPVLRENSQQRIAEDKELQAILDGEFTLLGASEDEEKKADPQLEEAKEVVKDMAYLAVEGQLRQAYAMLSGQKEKSKEINFDK